MHREVEARVHEPEGVECPSSNAGLLRTELTVEHPRLVLGPTMERLPNADVRSPCGLDGRPTTPTFFEIGGVDETRIERALSTDPTVTDCRCLARNARSLTYRVRMTGSAVVLSDPAADRGIEIQSAKRSGVGWRLGLAAPDREALSDFREHCLERGVDVSVERLYEVAEWSSGAPALSGRHRATLRAALEEGYFEIPRTATQHDLAERLGVSGSAVSQRLRRAMRELVSGSIEQSDGDRTAPKGSA